MFNLLALGLSLGLGVPIANKITNAIYSNERKKKNDVQQKLNEFFLKNNIDGLEINEILINDNGFWVYIEGDVKLYKLNFLKLDINKIFNALDSKFEYSLNNEKESDDILLKVILVSDVEDELYKYLNLEPFELLLGFGDDGYLIANMRKYPHVFIGGLTNMGKSKLLECIIKNLQDKALFFGIQNQKNDLNKLIKEVASTNGEIINLLKRIDNIYVNRVKEDNKFYKHIYIVIEEIAFLYSEVPKSEKDAQKTIQYYLHKFIKLSRAVNIYIIATTQKTTLDNCSIKDMFNTRISFRQVELQGYRNTLGITPDENLKQREFYLLTDELYKGYTFTL